MQPLRQTPGAIPLLVLGSRPTLNPVYQRKSSGAEQITYPHATCMSIPIHPVLQVALNRGLVIEASLAIKTRQLNIMRRIFWRTTAKREFLLYLTSSPVVVSKPDHKRKHNWKRFQWPSWWSGTMTKFYNYQQIRRSCQTLICCQGTYLTQTSSWKLAPRVFQDFFNGLVVEDDIVAVLYLWTNPQPASESCQYM